MCRPCASKQEETLRELQSANGMNLIFQCPDCPLDANKYDTADELETHIAGDHVDLCPYECERCRFAKFPTEFALVEHCRKDHGLREFHIRFKWTEDLERKRSEVKQKMRNVLRPFLSVDSAMFNTNGLTNGTPELALMKHTKIEDIASDCNGTVSCSPVEATLSVGEVLNEVLLNGQVPGADSLGEVQTPLISTGGEISPMDLGADTLTDYSALACQPFEEDPPKKPRDVVNCQLCGLKVSNQRSSLVYHTNTKHIKLDLYQCKVCQKTWQTIAKSDVLKHVKAVHSGDESMILDNRKSLATKLRHWTAKCFPPKETKRGRPPMSASSSPTPDGCSSSAMSLLGGVLEGAGLNGDSVGETTGNSSEYLYSLVKASTSSVKGSSSDSGDNDDDLDEEGDDDGDMSTEE